jgi:formyltetrahydrofolate deformylase
MPGSIGAAARRLHGLTAGRAPSEKYRDVGRLLITCPDRPGIVAAVSRFLYESGANIIESQQYSTDPSAGTFFLLVGFHLPGLADRVDDLCRRFAPLSDEFSMRWGLNRAEQLKKIAIFVSKADHVLLELLWLIHSGELNVDLRMVISNHQYLADIVTAWGIPFHFVPVSLETKEAAEAEQLRLLGDEVDLVVLARYMQILSPHFLAVFSRPIINIHHSFLPAFVGANPYQQAAERGVKLVGATAHYVTAELDAGPIIEQDIVRVDHRCSADDLRRLGRHVERSVLARAVAWHVDDRIIVHQNKTIVFA